LEDIEALRYRRAPTHRRGSRFGLRVGGYQAREVHADGALVSQEPGKLKCSPPRRESAREQARPSGGWRPPTRNSKLETRNFRLA